MISWLSRLRIGRSKRADARPGPRLLKPRRDLPRWTARFVCFCLALVGALPLAAFALTSLPLFRSWVTDTATRVVRDQVGLEASFSATLRAWPLAVVLHTVVVQSTDGTGPAVSVERVAVRPRFFALLQGRFDVGDIELRRPHVRLVVRDGQLENLKTKPQPPSTAPPSDQVPFASLSVEEASIDLDVDDLNVQGSELDVDVAAERGPAFDIALRSGVVVARRSHELKFTGPGAPAPTQAHDEDVLCKLDARVRVEPGSILVRRLRVAGAADLDPGDATTAKCVLPPDDPSKLEVELRNARASFDDDGLSDLSGDASVRGPLRVANRFFPFLPLTGWLRVEASNLLWRRGRELPDGVARIEGKDLALGPYRIGSELDGEVHLERGVIRAPRLNVGYSDGEVRIHDAEVRPLEPHVPLSARQVELDGLEFTGLMRDLGVTDHTHVRMHLRDGTLSSVQGTIDPVRIDSDLITHVHDFEVYDLGFDDPKRTHVIGVKQAVIRSKFAVRPNAIEFQDGHADFGKSHLGVFVSLGFDNEFRLRVEEGSHLDLSDVSPILELPWSGLADVRAEITGQFSDPTIRGEMAISRFEFAGFSFGDITSAKALFHPLAIDLSDVRGKKGQSPYRIPSLRLDFNGPASVLVLGDIESPSLGIRDLFAVIGLDEDPRFLDIDGDARLRASIRYDLGGPEDKCKSGRLALRAKAHLSHLSLFEELYDEGDVDLDYVWFDKAAQELGVDVDIRSLELHKGPGIIVGSATVRAGGVIRAQVAASGIPLADLQALGDLGPWLDATVSATATVEGTLDRLDAKVNAQLSPLRLGTAVLPSSQATIHLTPIDPPLRIIGRSRCGLPISAPFDRADYAADRPSGLFLVDASLFGGQVVLRDMEVTRQRSKALRGTVEMNRLDLGPLASMASFFTTNESPPTGHISGKVEIGQFEFDKPQRASLSLVLSALELQADGTRLRLREGMQPVTLEKDELTVPGILLDLTPPMGFSGTFEASGQVHHVLGGADLDLRARLLPTRLKGLVGIVPRLERADGTLEASVSLHGSPRSPRYAGQIKIESGAATVRGFPMPIDDVYVDVELSEREIRLARADARLGAGTVSAVGNLPVSGFDFGTATAKIAVRGLSLPAQTGVSVTVDGDLTAAWTARVSDGPQSIPRLSGDVTITSFEYTRPIAINADIDTLAQRAKRTRFEVFDPKDDIIDFEVRLRAPHPLRLRNNLMDMQLVLDSSALMLSGTNQRLGLRGELRVKPGGRLRLRSNEFEVRQGLIRFDDPSRIHPIVDVTAATEYRRYSQSQTQSGPAAAGAAATVGKSGGLWNIQLHAHGDADNLRIDLSSDPALSQEDIVLLLTLGVTRAELAQTQAANLGGSAALEALSALTGADSAVKGAIPVIDDFRLGTAYSSRTGRSEPTVTIGKRVTDRVRANVTSGLSENREVRSNLEWQLTGKTSVLGSYDNVNNASSSTLGNVGADIRFRIEFE